MTSKKSFLDYQSRSHSFQIGDTVAPLAGRGMPFKGTVVAVYPAIGQIDVQLPYGSQRFSVEEVIPEDGPKEPLYKIYQDAIPSGVGTVRVPGGPLPEVRYTRPRAKIPKKARVADRYIKKSMYWNGLNRQYRATRGELGSDQYGCPKCKSTMNSAIYKRRESQSSKLLCCPSCSFVIKFDDILGN